MIITLTLNPAIDRNITVDRLAFEDRAYITSIHESAGGRGINAACVIHGFGGETLALTACGGENGVRLEAYLRQCGFPVEIVTVHKPVRTNLTITDRQGLTVALNEAGPEMSLAELEEVEKTLRSRMAGARWLMLCGSLPPGVPTNFYARLVRLARKEGVRALLDCDGAALHEGIAEHPAVVTPNQQEAERLLSRALLTRTHFLEAAERIRAMGAESVVLSLGSRGAVGSGDHGTYEALPPRVDAVCPIGAGDAMAAAYVWSMCREENPAEALRWGVAAGTASVLLPGLRLATLEQARAIYRQVEVRPVE